MQNQNFTKKNKDSLASAFRAFAFSPWLIMIYLFVQGYVSRLSVDDQSTIKSFIEWFGTAYSLFLALVLVNVWAQFDTIDREFDLELDALATLFHTVKSTELPVGTKKAKKVKFDEVKAFIIENIKDYVKHVRKNYAQEHITPQQRRNGDLFLEQIDAKITSLAFNQDFPDTLTSKYFDSLNEAIDVRGDRISHSRQHTRGVVLLVAYVASIVWLLSFFGIVIQNPWIAIVLVGGATFVIVMVLTIISDLDKPFEGDWQVDLSDWDELRELIDPRLQIIFVYNIENTINHSVLHRVGRKICKLKSLSRTGFLSSGWNEFIKRISRTSVETSENVYCNVLFQNQLSPYRKYIENQGTKLETPMIILKQGDHFQVLLNSFEISKCSDLSNLEAELTKKIRDDFPWY